MPNITEIFVFVASEPCRLCGHAKTRRKNLNIVDLSKAAVLAALYNASKQQGSGFIHARGRKSMSEAEAQVELDGNPSRYFDYLHGRVMKIDLDEGDELNTVLYNRDNGPGAAETAIAALRAA